MTMKSFYAASIGVAIDQARREFGPDAIIVHSRVAPPESRHLGIYEVVVAADVDGPPEASPAASPQPAAARQTPPAAPADPRLGEMLAAMREELEAMRQEMLRQRITQARDGFTPELSTLFVRLLNLEFSEEFAARILNAMRQRGAVGQAASAAAVSPGLGEVLTRMQNGQPVPRRNITSLARLLDSAPSSPAARSAPSTPADPLRAELSHWIRIDATLGREGKSPRIAALVGPPGVGKTTALVKLAVKYGLVTRRPAHLISMDTQRIGAAEQLRLFAGILGVSFQAVETIGRLAQALEEHRQKELILIDTPGYSAAEMEDGRPLAGFFATRNDIDLHLVLNASTKSADLRRAVERFEIFRPAKLLISKIDETSRYGAVLEEAARKGMAISFLAAGKRIPEDIEPASKERLMELLLEGNLQQVRSAA